MGLKNINKKYKNIIMGMGLVCSSALFTFSQSHCVMAKDNIYNENNIIEDRYNGDYLAYTYYGFANMDGVWYKFLEGSVDNTFTGMGNEETGFCYFINGVQSFDYTGMAQNEYGWWYYINGVLQWDYTGIGKNQCGIWYYNNGNIDFSFTGNVYLNGTYYNVVNGNISTTQTQISCWGDSMTAGVGATSAIINTDDGQKQLSHADYPSDLAALTGYTVNNFGQPGATSDEIAKSANDYYSENITNDIVLIEIGSNGGWDNNYDTLIDQYQSVIDTAQSTEYIVIGDTDNPLESVDVNQTEYVDENQTEYVGHNETKWEHALSLAFGNRFFNTRLYLLDNGLSDVGLTPTEEDLNMIQKGNIPNELRYDWTHFNNYGYYSKALGIYKKGKELGYW